MREIEIKEGNENPFKESNDSNINKIIKKAIGSPCYYKDNKNGVYALAIINEFFEFQYFDENNMIFLNDMVYKGSLIRKLVHKSIDEENIVKLDLSNNGFGPLDIKYLTDFDLKNLKILDLRSNSVKPEGAFYLSHGIFENLESLNLSYNEIEDSGLFHISNNFFPNLSYLFLFGNRITSEGINYLIKAKFIKNLITLSLGDNNMITDTGVKILTEHKEWNKLNTLNLTFTGITDISLVYLKEGTMPALKKIYIMRNKFTENGKPLINELRKNKIKVFYLTKEERMKDNENEIKEKDSLDNPSPKIEKIKNKDDDEKFKFNKLNKYLIY